MLVCGKAGEERGPKYNAVYRPARVDVAGTGEIFGLVRVARTCNVRLHTCTVQNDESVATES